MDADKQPRPHELFINLVYVVIVGSVAAAGSSLFLYGLELATRVRNHWLTVIEIPIYLVLLPLVLLVTRHLYGRFLGSTDYGHRQVWSAAIVTDRSAHSLLSRGLAPLILLTTWLAHLAGASVGREGVAVQMAASIQRSIKVNRISLPTELLTKIAMAAGFASVFGTPIAALIFVFETTQAPAVRGSLQSKVTSLRGVLYCGLAALVADHVQRLIGPHHFLFPQMIDFPIEPNSLLSTILIGLLCGCLGRFFPILVDLVSRVVRVTKPRLFFGVVVLGLSTYIGGHFMAQIHGQSAGQIHQWRDAIAGLSLPILADSFLQQQIWWVSAFKLVLTVLSLALGFRGGEVTPLFVIGAGLGSSMGGPVFAAAGMLGLFASAARAPLTALALGFELFGVNSLVWIAPSILLAGSIGITGPGLYSLQRTYRRQTDPGRSS